MTNSTGHNTGASPRVWRLRYAMRITPFVAAMFATLVFSGAAVAPQAMTAASSVSAASTISAAPSVAAASTVTAAGETTPADFRAAGDNAGQRPAPRLEIMVYCPVDYPGDSIAYNSLQTNWRLIDTAALFQFTLDRTGRVVGSGDLRFRKLAKDKEFNLVPVVHNFVNGQFNGEMVRPSIVTLEGRTRAATAITSLVLDNGYSGVDIDFEGLTPDLRDPFSLFIKNLSGRLHNHGRTVSVAVPAKTRDNPSDSWSGAYDYGALGESADRLMIMAYDEHWAGGPAGPIASEQWVKRVVDYAVTVAPRKKILLGAPQYSYDWPAAGGPARYMSTPEAMEIAGETGAKILWDATAQAPHFYYWRGGEKRHVFMENSYSLAFKVNLAKSAGLAGIAIWRMGYEDQRTWEVVESNK